VPRPRCVTARRGRGLGSVPGVTDRRFTSGLRQLGLLLGAFLVGLALFLLVAVLAPDLVRVASAPPSGTSDEAAAASPSQEVALAWDDGAQQAAPGGRPQRETATPRPGRDVADDESPPGDAGPEGEAGPAADADDAADDGDDAASEGADSTADASTTDTSDTSDTPANATGTADASDAQAVLALVDAEREAAGCGPLTADPQLDALAGEHSADMAEHGRLDHTGSDGRTPWDRAADAGISGLAAENVARGQPDAEAVVAAWMDSSGHRANILACGHTRHGLGVVHDAGGPWWTQVFGR